MKIKFYPVPNTKGRIRNANRKEMNVEVSNSGLATLVIDMRDHVATLTMKDSSHYEITELNARDARVLCTGIFKAAEGVTEEEPEDPAADL